MAETTIADILALIGGPGLDDRNADARLRLAGFLCHKKWEPEDLHRWIEECMERGSRLHADYYHALQDLVISLGSHLGFEVEFGPYAGGGADIGYDGKWRLDSGEDILVEVKCSTWPVSSTSQLSDYMEQYCQAYGRAAQQVFGLYAVGDGEYDGLVDQVRGGECRNRIKVISFADLVRLLKLRRALEGRLPEPQVRRVMCDLLLPFDSINVGGILDIIQGVAGTLLEVTPGEERESKRCPEPAWRHSELMAYLDQCQPPQTLALLALCSAPGGRLRREELVRRMSLVAAHIPSLAPTSRITAKTITAAMARMSKQVQQRGKEALVEATAYSYAIRPAYQEWIEEWLEGAGLMPLRFDASRQFGGLFAQVSV